MATGGILLNGSSQYLEMASKVVSGFPFSMVIWVSSNGSGSGQFWFQQAQSNADRYASVWLDASGVGQYANFRNPGNGSSATKTADPQADATLRLCVGVFASTTSRTIYFSSSTGVSDTATLTDDVTNHDRVTIGAFHSNSGSPSLFMSGVAAEAHFFNTALSSSDFTTLLTTPPEDVSGWVDGWKLASNTDLTSIGGTRTLTATGSPTTGSLTLPYARAGGGATSYPARRSFTFSILQH